MEILVVGAAAPAATRYMRTPGKRIKELGLAAEVRKVEDLVEMVRMGIMSVPALVLDGRTISAGRTISKNQIKALLEQETK